MKPMLQLILSFTTASATFAQPDTIFIKKDRFSGDEKTEYVTDTILVIGQFENVVLYGTAILPNTGGQELIQNYGLILNSFSGSPCDEENHKKGDYSIITGFDKDLAKWTFDISYVANCCHQFLGDVTVLEAASSIL